MVLNRDISAKKVPMYKEPHLQRKSDQCAYLWKNWYNYKYGLQDEEKAEECRKLWGKCVEEHAAMCDHEVKTNPMYANMRDLNNPKKEIDGTW
ncbi:hypothetical protein SynMITS9220M01_237 [Synechococcus phage SynMITS9220M01]|nr:hypothetical protein SynMITS9220M01_237 [Synechococcus phage SynMITS9220M01]